MSIDVIRSEITTDELGRGYDGMTDSQVADSLNAVDRSVLRPLEHPALTRALAQGGRLAKLKRASEQWAEETKDVQTSIAMVAVAFITRDDSNLDPANPSDVLMVDALVATGTLSADDKTALINAATVQISRAEELGIGQVKPGQVEEARRA